MQEVLATPAKPRRWLTVVVKITAGVVLALRLQKAAKQLPKRRASEWPQDSVCVSWRGTTAGLRVEAGRYCLGLLRTVKSVSDGNG